MINPEPCDHDWQWIRDTDTYSVYRCSNCKLTAKFGDAGD